jgi:hypothetical protein
MAPISRIAAPRFGPSGLAQVANCRALWINRSTGVVKGGHL